MLSVIPILNSMQLTSFVSQDYDVAKGLNSHQQTFKIFNFPDKTILITLNSLFGIVYRYTTNEQAQGEKNNQTN